jgi:hypothetical protein
MKCWEILDQLSNWWVPKNDSASWSWLVGWLVGWVGLLNEIVICVVLTAVSMKLIFWDVIPYGLVAMYEHFRGTCCLRDWGTWHQVYLKCWHVSTKLYGITSQKTVMWREIRAFWMLHHVKKVKSCYVFLIHFMLYSMQQILQWVWTAMATSGSIIKPRRRKLVYLQYCRLVFNRCLLLVLYRAPTIWTGFARFSSDPPGTCWDSTTIWPWALPSKSFLIHYSLIILPFSTVQSDRHTDSMKK